MIRKSRTCFGKATGKPLSEYATRCEALRSAAYARREFGRELEAYECRHCGLWHLSPVERRTPSVSCDWCTSSGGAHKELYRSEDGALRRARFVEEDEGVRLRVYRCPYGGGWHLTKDL